MKIVDTAVRQPVTVAVGVILVVLVGLVGLQRIPIQLTPNVEDTIVAVTTFWEGASPQEVEQEVVDSQEEKLQGIANLEAITSTSQQSTGTVRLEFATGTPKTEALRETSDKLREVPDYPDNVDEPVIEASDPDNRDYIAWVLLQCDDPDFDVRTLQDFADDRIKPRLERIDGMSEINVLGGREREVQIRFDPVRLAQLGIPVPELITAITRTNRNVSAGRLTEDKSNVRVRLVSQYTSLDAIENTVVRETAGGPILVRDVAEVFQTYKEPTGFVRSAGRPAVAINAQKEVGANIMEVVARLDSEIEALNAPDGLLAAKARELGIDGKLTIGKVYDQTIYIDDALELVQSNIWLGGSLAILVLLLFLRSIRSAGIVALAIPISVIGAIAAMVALGRSINVISLAGMAFAVGMVVDNAIVVLENIYRHLEMGKTPMKAALDGAREVFGAVVAATLTTVVVFIPILLIEQEAGQLFRDIALAIVAAVSLSLVVSVTVIPSSAARLLKARDNNGIAKRSWIADKIADLVHWLCGSTLARLAIVTVLTAASLFGTYMLLPPLDYLPQGNRNLVFGLIIPPPGYNLDQLSEIGRRIEETMSPYYEAGKLEPGTPEHDAAQAALPSVPTFDFMKNAPGDPVVPPPIENYFLVTFDGIMFHGAVAQEPERVVDLMPLFQHATRAEVAPGLLAFGFQVPLFQLGGSTGSAVKVNFSGDDLDEVTRAAMLAYVDFIEIFEVFGVQPDPSNFNIPGPELQVIPDLVRLGELGMTPADLGAAVQVLGDGAILGDYRIGGQSIDLKLVSNTVNTDASLQQLADAPLATPGGARVPLASLAQLNRVNAPPQINRKSRQRSVTLQITPPQGMPLEQAVTLIDETLTRYRTEGLIPPTVDTDYTGSASKLAAVTRAMLGDGTIFGTLSSSLVLALLVVYLLMCVLFQSFVRPLIIMFSVPLATLGGFAALFGVFIWSVTDRYLPIQNLDILTMLGFVILIGVVVNNAILIVHQSLHFMNGTGSEDDATERMPPRRAIAEAVRSRVRPIFMSTATSVGGMAPLVLMPGSGSELYRGLGSVVLGGLIVSTAFTLLLVPLLLSLVTDMQAKFGFIDVAPEPVRKPVGGGSAAAVPGGPRAHAGLWISLALAASLGTTACVRPRASTPPNLSQLVDDIARGHVEALAASSATSDATAAMTLPSSTLPSEVANRIDELELLGGPASYEDIALSWDADLLGNARDIRAVPLRDSIITATERNLGLTASAIVPALSAEDIVVAEADFDPVFFTSARYDDVEQPRAVPVLQGVLLGTPENVTDTRRLEAGVRQRLSSTGATIEFGTFLQRFADNTDGIDFQPDPGWSTGISAEIIQPLLRDFGRDVTMGQVVLSRNAATNSRHVLRADMLTIVDATEQAYRTLDEAWRLLRIQQRLVEQGEGVESVLRARRNFDARPAEYADALAVVEQRRAGLIRSRRAVDAASDLLKSFVNDPILSPESEILVEPAETMAGTNDASYDLLEAVGLALENRPDVAQALVDIHDTQVREMIAANRLLPRLDLSAGVSLDGLDDDEREAFNSLTSDNFDSAFLALAYEIPIGNRAAKARHRQSVLRERVALIAYSQVVQAAILEVKDVLRNLQANRALVHAARTFRIAQTDNLRALLVEEESRSRLTPEFLALKFQRQERLAQAQSDEVRALANYHRAISALRRVTGTGLDHYAIVPVIDGTMLDG